MNFPPKGTLECWNRQASDVDRRILYRWMLGQQVFFLVDPVNCEWSVNGGFSSHSWAAGVSICVFSGFVFSGCWLFRSEP